MTRKGFARPARAAIAAYPALGAAQRVCSWGALRILTPDGLPIYQHSGPPLAAAHVLHLSDWLDSTTNVPIQRHFMKTAFRNLALKFAGVPVRFNG